MVHVAQMQETHRMTPSVFFLLFGPMNTVDTACTLVVSLTTLKTQAEKVWGPCNVSSSLLQ